MKRDIQFLFEIGTLRFVERTWKQFYGADFANVAEHTFRVMWIAALITKYEKKADLSTVLKMALVHDIAETRTGDVHYLSRQYTERNELLAMADIFNKTQLTDFEEVWHDYERRDSLEAKIVKDADTIDVELELREQQSNGIGLKRLWQSRRKRQIRDHVLFTKTAQKLWDQIEKSNPHAWHYFGRNRHVAGDWHASTKKDKKAL